MASVIVFLMREQGVASDVFVGLQTLDATIYQKSSPSFWCCLDLGSGWITAPVFPLCFSGFGVPQWKGRWACGGEGGWGVGVLGAKEKQPNGHLPMMQGNPPQDDWEVRMSHFPLGVRLSIIPPRYRWVPVRLGVNFSSHPPFFQLPSNHFNMASHLLCVKNSSESNLTLSNGGRFEFPLWDTGTSWETTTI